MVARDTLNTVAWWAVVSHVFCTYFHTHGVCEKVSNLLNNLLKEQNTDEKNFVHVKSLINISL